MELQMPLSDLRELLQYPDLITKITTAAATPEKLLNIDLAELAFNDPFALVEFILLARTLDVSLLLPGAKVQPPMQ